MRTTERRGPVPTAPASQRLVHHLSAPRNRLRYGVALLLTSLFLAVGLPVSAQGNDNHPPPCRVCHPMPEPTMRPAPRPTTSPSPSEQPTTAPADPEGGGVSG